MSVELPSHRRHDPLPRTLEKPRPRRESPVTARRPQDGPMKAVPTGSFGPSPAGAATQRAEGVPTLGPAEAQKLAAAALQSVSASGVPPRFDPRADVSGDGRVDILDLARIANEYGQAGPNLMGDIDASGRVDIFDLTRAASSYGASATQDWTDPYRPNFDVLSDFMSTGKDDIRGPYIRFTGGVGLNPFGDPDVRDAYYVVKDQSGNIAARGRLGVTGGQWDVVLRKDAGEITPGLMGSFRVNVTVYTQAPDGHWTMNTRDVGLNKSIAELLDQLK